MGLRTRLEAQLARQLGHPAGLAGRIVARGLNRGNAQLITTAVRALEPAACRSPSSGRWACSGDVLVAKPG
jgi:hypothetical protein